VTRPTERMPCPDCGHLFLPRGLASHRRHKHGGSASVATRRELEAVLELLAQLEVRLQRLETGAPLAAPRDDLRASLEGVLAEIRAVTAERATIEGEWAEECRLACDVQLGRLRERQARLLFELEELPLV
jgi:hypothetical protein